MWVARDKNGTLHLSIDTIQYRDEKLGEWCYNIKGHMKLPEDLFPELTWEDEPNEVFLNTGYDMANQINHVWAILKCTQDELNKANEKAMYYATKYEAIKKIVNE